MLRINIYNTFRKRDLLLNTFQETVACGSITPISLQLFLLKRTEHNKSVIFVFILHSVLYTSTIWTEETHTPVSPKVGIPTLTHWKLVQASKIAGLNTVLDKVCPDYFSAGLHMFGDVHLCNYGTQYRAFKLLSRTRAQFSVFFSLYFHIYPVKCYTYVLSRIGLNSFPHSKEIFPLK